MEIEARAGMRYSLEAIMLLFLAFSAQADEFGIRFNSIAAPGDTSLWEWPAGGTSSNGYMNGKMINAYYDHDFTSNFYLEGALGYRSYNDIFQYSTADYELSPGLKVQAGPVVLKLSEGVSYMPENSFDPVTYQGYNQINFVTHLTIGFKDKKTGIGIYLDRSHYSNGNSVDNPSLDYSGFQLAFPISW